MSRGLESLNRAMSFLRVRLLKPSWAMMRLTEYAGLNRVPNGSTIPAYTAQSPGLGVLQGRETAEGRFKPDQIRPLR